MVSERNGHPTAPPRPAGWVTALLAVVGAIMLLPGLCAIILMGMDPHEMMVDGSWALLVLALLLIGAAGVALIWWAVRRRRAGRLDGESKEP